MKYIYLRNQIHKNRLWRFRLIQTFFIFPDSCIKTEKNQFSVNLFCFVSLILVSSKFKNHSQDTSERPFFIIFENFTLNPGHDFQIVNKDLWSHETDLENLLQLLNFAFLICNNLNWASLLSYSPSQVMVFLTWKSFRKNHEYWYLTVASFWGIFAPKGSFSPIISKGDMSAQKCSQGLP